MSTTFYKYWIDNFNYILIILGSLVYSYGFLFLFVSIFYILFRYIFYSLIVLEFVSKLFLPMIIFFLFQLLFGFFYCALIQALKIDSPILKRDKDMCGCVRLYTFHFNLDPLMASFSIPNDIWFALSFTYYIVI